MRKSFAAAFFCRIRSHKFQFTISNNESQLKINQLVTILPCLAFTTLPQAIGNLSVSGQGILSNNQVTIPNNGVFAFHCPAGEQLIHNGSPSTSFNIGCVLPPGQSFRSLFIDIRCEAPTSAPVPTPSPTSAPTPSPIPTSAPTPPTSEDGMEPSPRTSTSNDCRIAYTELANNGVVGYRATEVTPDDTAFAFRLSAEEQRSAEYTYPLSAGETAVFTCANRDDNLLYQGRPIRPDSSLNFFTWNCPVGNQNEELHEIPLSCTAGQEHRSLRGNFQKPLN